MTASETSARQIVGRLLALADPAAARKMKRYAISTEHALGIPIPVLRSIAREYRPDHPLALALWNEPWHECRLLAPMVADPSLTTPELTDSWSAGFDSWDICDQCCTNLFRHTPHAFGKIAEYAPRPEEFVRRTAFSLIATLAVGDKKAPDEKFLSLFGLIETFSTDPRNFVKKAVNWALRQTGKRNRRLHGPALELSRRLSLSSDATARWIGRDALRELSDPKIIARIKP